MKKLYLVRHGNTFDADSEVLRIGARTDLSLANSGQAQAEKLYAYFQNCGIKFAAVYSSKLQRCLQTAKLVAPYVKATTLDMLIEIDYGSDDGQPESKVIERLGERALADWQTHAIVPNGWHCDPAAIMLDWQCFALQIISSQSDNVLVVSSQGIARFAPQALVTYASYPRLNTGAVSFFQFRDNSWCLKYWNQQV